MYYANNGIEWYIGKWVFHSTEKAIEGSIHKVRVFHRYSGGIESTSHHGKYHIVKPGQIKRKLTACVLSYSTANASCQPVSSLFSGVTRRLTGDLHTKQTQHMIYRSFCKSQIEPYDVNINCICIVYLLLILCQYVNDSGTTRYESLTVKIHTFRASGQP
jgi:hypothetical protein